MITLINRTGGQLVCTLNSGETLRLDNKQSANIKDSDVTSHIENLNKKGLVVCIVSKEVEKVEKPTQKKSKKQSKGGNNNG